MHTDVFLDNANIMFWPKKSRRILWISKLVCYHLETNPQPSYHLAAVYTTTLPVCYLVGKLPNFFHLDMRLIINQILRNRFFSKIVPVFRKYLSVSRWNLPGYFSVSFRFPQVTEFSKSTAIYLADSFGQLYSSLWSAWQEDPNDPQERCAMARTSCARL